MIKKLERLMEVCLVGLFAVLGVKAHEIHDTLHLALYVAAATVVTVWIVISSAD